LHGVGERFGVLPETALTRWATAGTLFAVLLTGFITSLNWRSNRRAEEDADWVAHTHAVQTMLQAAVGHAVDAETGASGFAATGQEAFLETYRDGQRGLARDLDTLRHLTADDAAQQKRLDHLRTQVDASMECGRKIADERQRTGTLPPDTEFIEGKRRMDAVRAMVAEMQGEEAKLLDVRVNQTQNARHLIRIIVSSGALFGVAVLIVAGFVVRREINHSARMRGQLLTLNAELEQRSTESRRAEEAAREGSRYARSLLEASLDPLLTISREGKITDVNEAAEKVAGVSRERLIDSDFSDYFTDPESARRGYEQVFAQGTVRDYPLAIRSTAGKVTDVLYNATVFKNEAGEVVGIFAAARDVTERMRAEKKLRTVSLYTRSLIEVSLDPLLTINREGKITDVNEATEKVTGISRERLIGSDFSDYFTEPAKARDGYQQVFDRGSVRDYPLAIRNTSGQVTDVLYNASVYRNDKGEIEGVFAAARDVTERRRAEEQVQQLNTELERRVQERTTELVAANKELEAFTYAVAHDLRAPLRHIHGFADILADECSALLDASGQQHLRRIREGSIYMSRLLEDLLDLSRMGRQELHQRVCGLDSIVREVVAEVKADCKDRDVEWRVGELTVAECDPALIQLVITNLLSNAVKFTRPCKPAVIEVGQTVKDGEPVLFVRDNGVGFDRRYADKLFGVFQRLHRKEDFEGTGVGLAIVQRIVHRHGGRVWAEGELNKGATFYFTLSGLKAGQEQLQAAQKVGVA